MKQTKRGRTMETETHTKNIQASDYRIMVIENRVRVYKGKGQITFHECSSYKMALDEAAKLQKQYEGASCTTNAPKMSEEKLRHLEYVKKEKNIQKEANKVKKSKDMIDKEMEELKRQLALLEG